MRRSGADANLHRRVRAVVRLRERKRQRVAFGDGGERCRGHGGVHEWGTASPARAGIHSGADAGCAAIVDGVGIAVAARSPVGSGGFAALARRVIAGSRHVALVGRGASHIGAEVDASAHGGGANVIDRVRIAVVARGPVRERLVRAGAVAVADGRQLARVRWRTRRRARVRSQCNGAAQRPGVVRAATTSRAACDGRLVGLGSAGVIRVLVGAPVRVVDRLDLQRVVAGRELRVDRGRPLPIDRHSRRVGDEVRGPRHRVDPARQVGGDGKRNRGEQCIS